jgi:hypothetical protein
VANFLVHRSEEATEDEGDQGEDNSQEDEIVEDFERL